MGLFSLIRFNRIIFRNMFQSALRAILAGKKGLEGVLYASTGLALYNPLQRTGFLMPGVTSGSPLGPFLRAQMARLPLSFDAHASTWGVAGERLFL